MLKRNKTKFKWICKEGKHKIFGPFMSLHWNKWPCCTSISMLRVHVHVACSSKCCLSLSMLYAHVSTACPYPCCMSVLCCKVLNIHVYAECSYPCCMSQHMLLVHVHAACSGLSCMSMLQVNLCSCWMSMSMQHIQVQVHAARTWICSIDLNKQYWNRHAAWTWTCSIWHGHAAWTWTWIQHGHGLAVWTWNCSGEMDTLFGLCHSALTWRGSMDMNMDM
jgi:hypothetical protein